MKRLIPYAGYEPPHRRKNRKRVIDAARALELKTDGRSWSEVGILLAEEAELDEFFCGDSVSAAVIRHRKVTT